MKQPNSITTGTPFVAPVTRLNKVKPDCTQAHFRGRSILQTSLLIVCLTLLATVRAGAVVGVLHYNGGNGGISFGVAPYGGAPNVGGPTYIADNVTGFNDILTSPGLGTLGGYLTASPVIANNIASYAGALSLQNFQVGGGNGSGAFGSGTMFNGGTALGLSLADSGPGGGSASYVIGTGVVTYTVQGAAIPAGTTYGAYLSMGGAVPLVGNADVESLRVHISDTAATLNLDLPQLALAISRNGAGAGIGNYNIVTIGGAGGGNAALILDNGVNGAFRSLAVDNQALAAQLPLGDVLTVSYALTAYTDPANFSSFDPTTSTDLLNLTGPLPADELTMTGAAAPEPSTAALLGLGLVGACVTRRRRTQPAE